MTHSVHIVCESFSGFTGVVTDEYGVVVNRIGGLSLEDTIRSLADWVGQPLTLELRGLKPAEPDRRGLSCATVIRSIT